MFMMLLENYPTLTLSARQEVRVDLSNEIPDSSKSLDRGSTLSPLFLNRKKKFWLAIHLNMIRPVKYCCTAIWPECMYIHGFRSVMKEI